MLGCRETFGISEVSLNYSILLGNSLCQKPQFVHFLLQEGFCLIFIEKAKLEVKIV